MSARGPRTKLTHAESILDPYRGAGLCPADHKEAAPRRFPLKAGRILHHHLGCTVCFDSSNKCARRSSLCHNTEITREAVIHPTLFSLKSHACCLYQRLSTLSEMEESASGSCGTIGDWHCSSSSVRRLIKINRAVIRLMRSNKNSQ